MSAWLISLIRVFLVVTAAASLLAMVGSFSSAFPATGDSHDGEEWAVFWFGCGVFLLLSINGLFLSVLVAGDGPKSEK